MFESYKKKWCEAKEKERESKDRSRDYIQKIHESSIRTEEGVKHLKEESKKTNDRLDKHEENEEGVFKDIKEKLEERVCPLQTEVDTLINDKIEQNGSIKEIKKTVGEVKGQVKTILTIAEARRSLWKEVGAVIGAIAIIAGIFYGAWEVFN